MAYRIDPNGDLVIDGWERGISEGPYSIFSPSALGPINQTGIVDLSYVNITGIPGEVSVQMPLIAVNKPVQSFTLTGSLSGGATSATLVSPWTNPSNSTVRATFSNGNARSVVVTNGSANITWSGGLSSSATNIMTIQWVFTGPIQFTTDYTAFDYVLDLSGRVWTTDETSSANVTTWTARNSVGYLSSSNTAGTTSTTFSNNGGCVWWQGYLFVMYLGSIYYSHDNGDTFTDWTGTVGSIVNGNNYAVSSKTSNSMYFCNGSGIGGLYLVAGTTFNPANTSTFTYNFGNRSNAVTIPNYDTATCLAELNGSILIGGLLNRVYPWDAQNFQNTGVTNATGLPLFIGDKGITRIVVVNSNAYIFPGIPTSAGTLVPAGRGYIYITNGSTVDVFKKMPDNFVTIGGTNSNISNPYWSFGDAIWHRNQLLFGAQAVDNATNSTITDTAGIWSIDIASGALYRVNTIISGDKLVTGLLPFSITNGNITTPGLGYFAADNNGGFNNSSATPTTSGRVISDKIPTGTKFESKNFEQIELKLAAALVAGESIDVVIVTDLDPTGHTIGSMTSSDGMSKVFTPLNLSSSNTDQGLQWLQVKCTLNPTATNPTFVRLREIRIR